MEQIGIRPEEEEDDRRRLIEENSYSKRFLEEQFLERIDAEDINGEYGSLALENIYDNEMIALWL